MKRMRKREVLSFCSRFRREYKKFLHNQKMKVALECNLKLIITQIHCPSSSPLKNVVRDEVAVLIQG